MRSALTLKVSASEHDALRGIPVLCVAGAGAKADPSRLRIADVSESNVDPLARAVRQTSRCPVQWVYGMQMFGVSVIPCHCANGRNIAS